jgi:hypothetical protein
LEIDIRDGRADVVRVQVFAGDDVLKLDPGGVLDKPDGLVLPVQIWVALFGGVDDAPVVVVVAMGVESDLLLWKSVSGVTG